MGLKVIKNISNLGVNKMFLGVLFLFLVGNGIHYYNKNKQIDRKLAQMRKEGRGMYVLDKDGKVKFIPM